MPSVAMRSRWTWADSASLTSPWTSLSSFTWKYWMFPITSWLTWDVSSNFPTCAKSMPPTTLYLLFTRSYKKPTPWKHSYSRVILFAIRTLNLATFQMIWMRYRRHSGHSSVVDLLLWVWAVSQLCNRWNSSNKNLPFLFLILNHLILNQSALLTMVQVNKCSNHHFCRRSRQDRHILQDLVWITSQHTVQQAQPT